VRAAKRLGEIFGGGARGNAGGAPRLARRPLVWGGAGLALAAAFGAWLAFGEGATRRPLSIEVPPPAAKTPRPAAAPAEAAQQTAALPAPARPAARPPAGPPAQAPAWRRHAVAAAPADGRPRIVVVVDDMGVDAVRSARAMRLPGPLTMAFLTYAVDLPRQAAAARAAGHELLLHVAMEPENADMDPGPHVLLASQGADEILRRLRLGLARFEGYVGVNNHMGSKFTKDAAAMTVVLEELRGRGLLFLDSRTTAETVGASLARRLGVAYAERQVFLDNDDEEAAVWTRLQETEAVAKRQGYAIAIGHPRDATLKALAAWLPRLQEAGFVLAPLTAVAITPPDPG
jgi:polysaccharide deacetylase 2 family uncharacterized protein YibQ